MAKFTLLELHVEDAEFTAHGPGIETGSDETAAQTEPDGDGGPPVAVAVVALLAVAVVALAVRKVRGSDDSEAGKTSETPA